MNELVKKQEMMPTSSAANPMTLLEMAIDKGADIDQLEKLMALQERYDAKQAKSSFLHAMTEFQSIVPRITKNKDGHNCKYAPLSDIVEQIKSSLSGCGLSYRFEQEHAEEIKVTCVVSHIDGHSEKTTMQARPDDSGKKNQVQSIGSTVTYLQRYTMIGALGITTADSDMDGRLPSPVVNLINSEQALELDVLLDDSEAEFKGFKAGFLNYWSINDVSEVHENNFDRAKTEIQSTFKKRKDKEAVKNED